MGTLLTNCTNLTILAELKYLRNSEIDAPTLLMFKLIPGHIR